VYTPDIYLEIVLLLICSWKFWRKTVEYGGEESNMERRTFLYKGLIIGAVGTFAGCGIVGGGFKRFEPVGDPPKYDILLKGEKRVAIVPRYNSFELQNVSREIAQRVNSSLDANVQNKKLRIVEQSRVEAWLDNANNDFDTFLEVGRDSSINADIVIGFDIIRDPQSPSSIQKKCFVQVQAFDTATGRLLASETLAIVEPPPLPIPIDGTFQIEQQFNTYFIGMVARQISSLFHHTMPRRRYGISKPFSS